MYRIFNMFFLLPLFFLSIVSCSAKQQEDTIHYKQPFPYKFVSAAKNEIKGNIRELFPVMEQLRNLRRDSSFQVSIVHLGDSHVQPDFLTGYLRTLFQSYFGNAGRGLIAPLKMAKTNEPHNYKIYSDNEWTPARCVKPSDIPIGVAGLGLFSQNACVNICAETYDKEMEFSKVKIFYDKESAILKFDDAQLLTKDSISPFSESLCLKNPLSTVHFELQANHVNKGVSFYGLELENGKAGVLYHAIGINGAQYSNYCSQNLFTQQLADLSPSLFIISLGTNEAYGRNFDTSVFYTQIDNAIQDIKKSVPNARFLLTTPVETFIKSKKKRMPNPKTKLVQKTIISYATKNNIAYWDLYAIGGGVNSATQWNRQKLMARDGIHFTKDSYEFQAALLFEAFMGLYNQYLNRAYVQN